MKILNDLNYICTKYNFTKIEVIKNIDYGSNFLVKAYRKNNCVVIGGDDSDSIKKIHRMLDALKRQLDRRDKENEYYK